MSTPSPNTHPISDKLVDIWAEIGHIPLDPTTVEQALHIILSLRTERNGWRQLAKDVLDAGRPDASCRHTWSDVDHDLVECTACGWTTQPHIAATFDMHHAPSVEVAG